jgi:hypothetical protein
LAPEDNRVRTNLGLTLAAAGRTAEALPLLSQSDGDAVGHANLGYLLAATGQFDLARSQYEAALAMRPDLELARRALAKIAVQDHPHVPPAAPAGVTAQLAPPAAVQTAEASVKPGPAPPVAVQAPAPSPGQSVSPAVTAQLVLPVAITGETSVQLPSLPRVEGPVAAPPPANAQVVRSATNLPKADAIPASTPRVRIPPPVPSSSRPPGTLSAVTDRSSQPAAHTLDARVKPASAPRVQIPPPVPKRLLPQAGTGASAGSKTLSAAADANGRQAL